MHIAKAAKLHFFAARFAETTDCGIEKRHASVEKYTVMIKRLALSILIVLMSFPLSAETTNTVSLRFGRQEDGVRVVLESGGDFITGTTISTSPSLLEIAFPSDFDIIMSPDFPYGVSREGRILYIDLKGKDILDVKVSRLSDPARLVFDLKTAPKPAGELAGVAVKKPQTPALPTSKNIPSALPLAAHAQNASRHELRVVVIDPGHGGYDYGILSKDATEKDTDLALAKDLSMALTKKGVTVYLTRRADQYVPIEDRILFSNKKAPDLFISIHSSLSNRFALYISDVEDLNADDAVTPYLMASQQRVHLEQSRSFAKSIGKAIAGEFSDNVVLRQLPLPLLNGLKVPAVLMEYPSVKSVRYDQKMLGMVVGAIMKGIAAYDQ
jgi:N-acetylmuramoyl-L-alanine amidase